MNENSTDLGVSRHAESDGDPLLSCKSSVDGVCVGKCNLLELTAKERIAKTFSMVDLVG